jgi:predicted dinucleotide-utilizing enzyme
LEKKELSEAARSALRNSIPVVEKIDDLLARDPELIAEIASREAVYEYGQKILDAGKDLLVISV